MKLAALLLLATAAWAADPIIFRGAYIGQPISDFVDCSSGKAKPLKDGYKTRGNICEGRHGYIFHTQIKGLLNPRESGERLEAEDRKLEKITILIPNEDWDKVSYDLTQKLGNPVSEVPDVYQNNFGARWEFNKGFWIKEDIVAYAGIKVLPVQKPFSSQPATDGIEIKITDAKHAKLPATRPSTLD